MKFRNKFKEYSTTTQAYLIIITYNELKYFHSFFPAPLFCSWFVPDLPPFLLLLLYINDDDDDDDAEEEEKDNNNEVFTRTRVSGLQSQSAERRDRTVLKGLTNSVEHIRRELIPGGGTCYSESFIN